MERINFDEYETVVLVYYYLQFKNGLMYREDAIEKVSYILRERAYTNRDKIDDSFRSIAGITRQMKKVEEEYLEKKYTQSTPSILIRKYITMYKNDLNTFISKLKEFKIGLYSD